MAGEANRYLFLWMAAPQACRALERDAVPTSWVSFVPGAGRIVSGVRLSATFSRDIGNAAARGGAVLVFDREALPPGGHDLDGRAAYDLTVRALGAKGAGDDAALRRIVRAARENAECWSASPDEHLVPFDLQPSRHGLVAVGLLQPGGPIKQADSFRAAAERLGVPCVEASVPIEMASGIGRAVAGRRRAVEAALSVGGGHRPIRTRVARDVRPRGGDVYDAISAADWRSASPLGILEADAQRGDRGIGRGLRLETVGDGFGGIDSVRIADGGLGEVGTLLEDFIPWVSPAERIRVRNVPEEAIGPAPGKR